MTLLYQAGCTNYLSLATFKLELGKWSVQVLVSVTVGLSVAYYQTPLSALAAAVLCLLTLCLCQVAATLFYLYGPPLRDMARMDSEYISPPDNNFWVAEARDSVTEHREIVGTIAIVKKIDTARKKEYGDVVTLKVARLRRMAVDHRFRRLGIGEQLVKECVSFCRRRQYDVVELFTTELHAPAQKLYSKLGFTKKDASRHTALPYFLRSYDFHLSISCSGETACKNGMT